MFNGILETFTLLLCFYSFPRFYKICMPLAYAYHDHALPMTCRSVLCNISLLRKIGIVEEASKLSAIYCTVDLVLELLLFRSFVHLLPPPLLNVNGFPEDFVFGLE